MHVATIWKWSLSGCVLLFYAHAHSRTGTESSTVRIPVRPNRLSFRIFTVVVFLLPTEVHIRVTTLRQGCQTRAFLVTPLLLKVQAGSVPLALTLPSCTYIACHRTCRRTKLSTAVHCQPPNRWEIGKKLNSISGKGRQSPVTDSTDRQWHDSHMSGDPYRLLLQRYPLFLNVRSNNSSLKF